MLAFWRDTPLSGKEFALLDAVTVAHRRSALRNNASTVALKNSAGGSGSFEMALASAILTLGGRHAPIQKIYEFLDKPLGEVLDTVEGRLCDRQHIQGWGNSFFKGRPDPDWEEVAKALSVFPDTLIKLEEVTKMLHAYKKPVYPNAGAYTAAAAFVVGIPANVASYLLINARLPVWAHHAQQAL